MNWIAPHQKDVSSSESPRDFRRAMPPRCRAEERRLSLVDALRVEGCVDVYVRRGACPRLEVAAEFEEDTGKVRTTIDGDTLVVSTDICGTIVTGNGSVVINGIRIAQNGVRFGGIRPRAHAGPVDHTGG